MPAVSIIIPVYNVEPYMALCAWSLCGQTLQDIEFIFIDDCSPEHPVFDKTTALKDSYKPA